MTIKIEKGGNILDGTDLVQAVRSLAQATAKIQASAITAITDNSGGTETSPAIAAIPNVTAFTVTGTDLAPKAGFDTGLGAIKNALKTISVVADTTADAVSVPKVTYNGAGTDGSGTVAAISAALTAVDGGTDNGLAFAGTNDLLLTYKNAVASLAGQISRIRVAVGLSELTDNSGGSYAGTVAALTATTGTGVDGTSLSGVEEEDAEAVLAAFKNAVATLAEALNEAVSTTVTLDVVAVQVAYKRVHLLIMVKLL